ncbi:MAG: T9SS type A sorting domain-containing protein, partial [Cryomorphaceae bacterium]
QNTEAFVINGYQDNGTAIWDANGFRTERGGDGMECIIDYANDNYVYASVYYGNVARSTNGGYSFGSFAAQNVNGITESGAWVAPYIQSNSNSQTMFFGYKNVWRTTNAYASSPSFTAISNSLAGSNSSNMRQLRQSKVNSNRLFALRSDNKLFRSDNALGTSPTWTDLSSSLPSGWYISDIETSPQSNNRIFMIRSNVVYQSNNGGASWFSINGNLPGVSKNCLVADPYTDGGLYVGTDAGVYYKDNSLSNWVPFYDGLPTTAEITELEIYHVEGDWQARKLRAGTYGRGLWESDLYDPGNLAAMAFGDYELNGAGPCDPGTFKLTSTSAYGVDSLRWNVYPSKGAALVSGSNPNTKPAYMTITAAGTYDVYLYVENSNGSDSTLVISNFTVNTPAAVLLSNSINDEYCEGDTAIVSANLGMTAYDFYLNGSLFQVGSSNTVEIPNVQPGDVVEVNITDPNGCTDDTELNLNVWPAPTSQLTSDEGSQICEGDTVAFSNNGSGISNHDFHLNGTSVQSGAASTWVTSSLADGDSINVLIIDTNGCSGVTSTITMSVIPIPPTPTIAQLVDSLECTILGTIYQWKRNDTITATAGQYYLNPDDAFYSVRINQDGCWSDWSEAFIVTGTGVSVLNNMDVKVYPSPADQSVFIEFTHPNAIQQIDRISVIDMLGKSIISIEHPQLNGSGPFEIDIQSLPSGVYSILLKMGPERIAVPIVKEKR